jgi:hypothetical protein
MSHQSASRLARAELAAKQAREDLAGTLDEIQYKLSPANLISETKRNLREKGFELTDQLIGSVKSRPIVAAVAASGLAWLVSKRPALAMLLKLFLGGSATSRRAKHSADSNTQPPPRRRRTPRPAVTPKETA